MFTKHYNTLYDTRQPFLIRVALGVIAVAVFFVLLMPSAYVVQKPGPIVNVLGSQDGKELITDPLVTTGSAQPDGELMLLTVSVYGGPGSYTNSVFALPSLINSNEDVLPTVAVYKPNISAQAASEETHEQMTTSQNSAILAASKYLNKELPDTKIAINNIGGPSAGLIFTLGIIEKVGGEDVTRGRKIAATGTIDAEGHIGQIGGVKEKLIAAQAQGAEVFVAPAADLAKLQETMTLPTNIKIIPATDIAQVTAALAA
jgi:PDZ domain-containing protein